jgi:hypothetical protein
VFGGNAAHDFSAFSNSSLLTTLPPLRNNQALPFCHGLEDTMRVSAIIVQDNPATLKVPSETATGVDGIV